MLLVMAIVSPILSRRTLAAGERPAPTPSPPAITQSRFDLLFRVLICTVLYAIPAVVVTRAVTDWDIWWHLRTGQWVLENRDVPSTDPFSAYGQDKAWAAYSWLFEVIVY